VRHFLEWPETAQTLKRCDRNRHLGLVVVILVLFGVLLVQLFRQLLVRVCLDRKCFLRRQDLEQEWQLLSVLLHDIVAHEHLVVLDEVLQRAFRLIVV